MVLLSGCGGGGGGTGVVPPAQPAVANLSVSTNSVSMSADVSEATPSPAVVQVNVANAPSANLAYAVTWSGSAVISATFAWQSSAQGQLTIVLPDPALLGAGTYTGSVRLSVCNDSACNQNISGSPVNIPVTYTVTMSSSQPATFTVQTQAAGFEAHTADVSPPIAMFNVYLKNVPAAGLYIQPSQPKTGFITAASDTQSVDTSGQITVAISLTLVTPATLGSGFFSSSVTFMVCYDKACQHQLAGSPATEPISYTVFLTEGHEYSLRTVNVPGISDLAYDGVGQRLYVSALSGYRSSFSGTVTQVDPLTGSTGTQTALADDPFGIATSDDGSYVYVGSQTNPVVHRLKIPSLTADLDVPLGSGGSANLVSELAVAPGAPHTLAVSLGRGLSTAGTVIFDDAVARPQSLVPIGYYSEPDAIVWGASAALLYVSRSSEQIPLERDIASVTVDSSGLTIASSVSIDPSKYAFGRTFYASGRAYDIYGHVVDATSGAPLGQFNLPLIDYIVTLLPDPSHGRVFFLQPDGARGRLLLLNFDASTFALRSVANLGLDTFDVALTTHLIPWGSDGIAFNRNGVEILAGTFAAPPSATAAALPRAVHSSVHELAAGSIYVAAPRQR
jgi:hypothetical protein